MKLSLHTALALGPLAFAAGCLAEPGTATPPPVDTTQVTAAPDVSAPDTSAPDVSVPDTRPLDPTPRGFVVHEWGTFTSVQDAAGKSHPGLHHEDEELPAWVYRRDLGPNAYFEELPEEPLQQLETPVLYFYSEEALDVQVHVDFPEGIISQWYPGATAYAPEPYAMSAIADGHMRWDVTVDPGIERVSFLPVDPHEIWAPSRNVASTPVAFKGPDLDPNDGVPGVVEHEQFIFYRGLGNFDLPVRVTSSDETEVRISNASSDDLAALVILRSTADGGAVSVLGRLPAGQSLQAAVPTALASRERFEADARAALKTAIVATGLYDDEAQAMVDTWTRSWFGNVGLRVLYIVPRSWTDRLLPLRVTPEPSELVRTLVGRIEVMTPATQRETWDRIASLGANPSWEVMEALIDELGRFAEPRIRQALDAHGGSEGGGWLLDAAHQRP